jgi:hypothetical protein
MRQIINDGLQADSVRLFITSVCQTSHKKSHGPLFVTPSEVSCCDARGRNKQSSPPGPRRTRARWQVQVLEACIRYSRWEAVLRFISASFHVAPGWFRPTPDDPNSRARAVHLGTA